MKCPAKLYRERDLMVEFCTGYILRSNVASIMKGKYHLTTDALCYLAEWKHVLVFGRRISTAAYRVRDFPVMDFNKKLEDPCQDVPQTGWDCVEYVIEGTKDLNRDQAINLCHSTMPAILCDNPVDMVYAKERYREMDIYEPEKQESLNHD